MQPLMLLLLTAKPATVTFSNGETDADKKIDIVVALDNIGNTAEQWTPVKETAGTHTYFYYNNDVEEGDSTSKLVDSVKLSDETQKTAYLAFDFDLSVLLDSIQVTYGPEVASLVKQCSRIRLSLGIRAQLVQQTISVPEISKIAWPKFILQ